MSSVRKIKDTLNKGEGKDIYANTHPKIQGYENIFRTKQAKDSDTIFSTSHVDLLFLVKKKLHNIKHYKDDENCYMIDFNLVASAKSTSIDDDQSDGEDFKAMQLLCSYFLDHYIF